MDHNHDTRDNHDDKKDDDGDDEREEEHTMTTDKRLIEESFPVKEVSLESVKEKSIRHGHISTLHIWWARRPLASSRATAYAALVPPPKDDEGWQKQRNFIIELSKWENSNNFSLIEKARIDILNANGGIQPKVLDPFGGGGSIPLEALRLGCETYSNDYNPVAVLIQKCTLEYPQKYGHCPHNNENWGDLSGSENNPLIADIKKWGSWILEEAKKEIGKFYPPDPDGSIPIGYIWARTIPCQNPSCSAEIPLIRQYWLSKKEKRNIAFFAFVKKGQIQFKIVGDGYEKMPDGFDPERGTIAGAVTTCPCCGSTIDAKTLRTLFQNKQAKERMIAVLLKKSGISGKKYRISTEKDLTIFSEANKYLNEKIPILREKWGIEPIPDEIIHTPDNKKYTPGGLLYNFTPVLLYGKTTWGDLFNSRQQLTLITFIDLIRRSQDLMRIQKYDENYIKALSAYFGLGADRLVDYSSTLCVLNPTGGRGIVHTFGRQALQMTWDYGEINPFYDEAAGWVVSCEKNIKWISHSSAISNSQIFITQSSATNFSFDSNTFDAIFTDPPYYDNVPYSDLSDFFYVWLKRSIGNLFPELFSTMLTPKTSEAIAELPLLRGMKKNSASLTLRNIKTKEHFEEMLKKSFQEIYRLLKPNGITIIVYAHKSTEGWETLINSLLDSGLIITGAYPLNTEMAGRLRSQDSAALASSIYIIARKMERQPTGFYNNVKEELKTHLNKKLEQLWNEGISGADFFIAAIGSAIEVFGKYEQVMDYEGNIVRADRLLVDVRKIATDYAVRQILHNGFVGEISDLARLYVLWRWNYSEAKVPFDEGRKLGQSCGIDISHEWSHTGFVKKEKEFIRLLGPQERKLEDLEGSKDMIDVLHQVLLLWEKSRRDEMIKVLQVTGYGKSEAFYRVAQAISESLPIESKEKKLLDGFLAGRERMSEEVKKEAKQTRLEL